MLYPQGALSAFLKFAIPLLSLLDIIIIRVLHVVAILCEDVLTLNLNIVNLGLKHLLTAHPVLAHAHILVFLQVDFICSILQLFLNLDLTLLLVAQDGVVLLDFVRRVVLPLHSSLPLITDHIQFLFLELPIILFAKEIGRG